MGSFLTEAICKTSTRSLLHGMVYSPSECVSLWATQSPCVVTWLVNYSISTVLLQKTASFIMTAWRIAIATARNPWRAVCGVESYMTKKMTSASMSPTVKRYDRCIERKRLLYVSLFYLRMVHSRKTTRLVLWILRTGKKGYLHKRTGRRNYNWSFMCMVLFYTSFERLSMEVIVIGGQLNNHWTNDRTRQSLMAISMAGHILHKSWYIGYPYKWLELQGFATK